MDEREKKRTGSQALNLNNKELLLILDEMESVNQLSWNDIIIDTYSELLVCWKFKSEKKNKHSHQTPDEYTTTNGRN